MPLKILLRLLTATSLLAACGGPPAPGGTDATPVGPPPAAKTVNVYNWGDYIAPGVVEEFQAATGIHVNYDIFDSQEMLETKLLAGRSGYGYTWGTVGIGYDESKLRELAPGAPTDTWSLVYDPTILQRLEPCGVSVVDSPSDVIGTVLAWTGHDANRPTPEQLQAAERTLLTIRPYLRKIDTGNQINDLAGRTICLMVTWSTNVQVARNRAREAGVAADFRYVVPKEGSVAWFDSLAIPADAPHPEAAHAFIEFMLRPDIAARNASFIGSASMNAAATPLVDAELRDDPGVYPAPALRERLQPLRARSLEQSREENRIWARFRTGE
jgi:putrescine transport system substrate-binding protein